MFETSAFFLPVKSESSLSSLDSKRQVGFGGSFASKFGVTLYAAVEESSLLDDDILGVFDKHLKGRRGGKVEERFLSFAGSSVSVFSSPRSVGIARDGSRLSRCGNVEAACTPRSTVSFIDVYFLVTFFVGDFGTADFCFFFEGDFFDATTS